MSGPAPVPAALTIEPDVLDTELLPPGLRDRIPGLR